MPLIAVRKEHVYDDPLDKHYAPGVSFPVTAFLRCLAEEPSAPPASPISANQAGASHRHRAVLELTIRCNRPTWCSMAGTCRWKATSPRRWPIHSTTQSFAKLDQPTTGLLYPDRIKKLTGIYMLEPYEPGKIPVLMVHGLWSSPITWMEMFNDLRSDPDLRRDYQFWFYLYPTGQPFWRSATQLREDLAQLRKTVDPTGQRGSARSNGAGRPQHGRADCEHADRQQPRRLLAHRQRSTVPGGKGR